MPYRITFRGRWEGVLNHAFADLAPTWDAATELTVVVVPDQPALTAVLDRASEYGLSIVDARELDDHRRLPASDRSPE